ncbi:MAG: response regulator transcription factor [Gemmatimonadaceae bacterium]
MSSLQAGQQQTRKRRVFLVDDHPIVRQGLTLLIDQEPELTVCGVAEDAESVPASIAALAPDIVVLDISLKGPDGLELLKTIRSVDQTLPILVLSMHDETIYAERALRAGANGYIMKQEATDKVLVAIRRILRNEVYVSERIANGVLQQMVLRRAQAQLSSVSSLSDRELEVFRLIGFGHGTREIADALHLSIKTIESYQAHIKEKLGIATSRALMQRAIESRLSETA